MVSGLAVDSFNSSVHSFCLNRTGYSGADITAVCRDAAMNAMRKRIKGLTPDQIRGLDKNELDLPATLDDCIESVKKCCKTVSHQDLDKYKKWMDEFGSV